ncbi:MAG TPA: stage II sporulation protein M [Candidatus Binataceae bacterium]|nr:stage II sporulation protein M [Candidatus Binataceae bacterium]
MNETDHKAAERLGQLLDDAESVRSRLSFDELRELARLYRVTSARLAILRSRDQDPEAIHYLNALCVRAYTHLQVSAPRRHLIGSFFLSEFPATLAATAWLQVVVAVLMLTGALVGWAIVSANPPALSAIVPSSMYPPIKLDRLAGSAQERARFLARPSLGFGLKSVFSAGLFVHNTKVGLFAFTTGILAGIPTVLLVFYNGLTLGAFVWIFSRDSGWPVFWAWLLPHAIPELLAVTLCSTGGLVIAKAVVVPGRQGVAAALREAALPALQLVLASFPLFLAAAGLESFLRESALSTASRFAAAGASLVAITAYVWYVHRLAQRHAPLRLDWLLRAGPPAGSQDSGSIPAR